MGWDLEEYQRNCRRIIAQGAKVMGVNDPGTLLVECDECGEAYDFDTTEYAGDPPSWGIDDETLQAEGWDRTDGEVLCPKCVKKRDE